MNCHEIRVLADAFVDCELKGAHKERVGSHITQCPACRMWIEMVQRARDTVRTKVVKRPAPEGLEAKIRDVVDRARGGPGRG